MDTSQQPAPTRTDHNIWPSVTAADPLAIREWLAALGFAEGILVPGADGEVRHSEMLWPEGGRVMVSSATKGDDTFVRAVGSAVLYIVTDEPDAVLERANAAGVEVTRGMEESDYGSRGFSLVDPEGNSWSFGTYAG